MVQKVGAKLDERTPPVELESEQQQRHNHKVMQSVLTYMAENADVFRVVTALELCFGSEFKQQEGSEACSAGSYNKILEKLAAAKEKELEAERGESSQSGMDPEKAAQMQQKLFPHLADRLVGVADPSDEQHHGLRAVRKSLDSVGLSDDARAAGGRLQVERIHVRDCSLERFKQEFVGQNRPVILTGVLDDWTPITTPWDDAHLVERSGHRSITVRTRAAEASTFGDVRRVNMQQSVKMNVEDVVASLQERPARVYAARLVLAEDLPELLEELEMLPHAAVFGAPIGIGPTCWLGADKQQTPLHFDAAENLLCVVDGAKHIQLFPPWCAEGLYPDGRRQGNTVFSRVDIYDPECYPQWHGVTDAIDLSTSITVEKGEMLYLPVGWWHAVSGGDGRNFTVNYWFELSESKRDADIAACYVLQGMDRSHGGETFATFNWAWAHLNRKMLETAAIEAAEAKAQEAQQEQEEQQEQQAHDVDPQDPEQRQAFLESDLSQIESKHHEQR